MNKIISKTIQNIEKSILKKIGVSKKFPIQLDITNACNLACSHCYHTDHLNKGAIRLEDWKLIVDQSFNFVNKYGYEPQFIICGGEPLVSSILFPLLNYIYGKHQNTNISILTNATLVDPSKIENFKNFSKLSFQVSIDGPNQEVHDFFRGKGNYERSLKGIRLLKDAGVRVTLSAVLTRKNSDCIESFFILAKSLKVDEMNFTRFITNGFGRSLYENQEDRPLLPLELRDSYKNILRYSAQYIVKSKVQGPLFNLLKKELGYNSRFWESAIIDYKGNLVASSRSRIILGNVLESGLESLVLNNPLFKALRKGKVETCGKCEHYSVCGGDRNAAFAATGNFLGPDPGCWKNIS